MPSVAPPGSRVGSPSAVAAAAVGAVGAVGAAAAVAGGWQQDFVED